MTKSSPFIQDRVIPVSPALALFLGYIPNVDDRSARDKNKPSGFRRKQGESARGINRALVLTQLNHRLLDSAVTDRRLFSRNDVRWYARSYHEWHTWDFCFMPFATMVKTFQDLIDSGYIMARLEKELVAPGEPIDDRRSLLRVMGVYNGKCFSIDYAKLERAMADDARVQAYLALMFPARMAPETDPATSDQGDQTRDHPDQTSDQGDQTPAITLIRPRDQGDQTPAIRVIRPPDHPDQRSSESESESGQRSAESSSSSAPPGPEPDSRTGEPPGPSPAPRLGYTKVYDLLTQYGVNQDKAKALAISTSLDRAQAWLDFIYLPKSGRKPIENKAAYLVTMLTQEGAWPPGHKKNAAERAAPVAAGQRFINGPLGDEIKR